MSFLEIQSQAFDEDGWIAGIKYSLGIGVKKAEKYRLLQKYYHKGAFYTDDPLLRKRGFTEAMERDSIDSQNQRDMHSFLLIY